MSNFYSNSWRIYSIILYFRINIIIFSGNRSNNSKNYYKTKNNSKNISKFSIKYFKRILKNNKNNTR